ncbi:hypothetical protein [Chengkuizengella axinellae]|uniref:GerMN domain-containing protein n=1 Tax=Chengkuizengella axinellae TaxID=3064388 RepID=A0ABT9J3F0_9BACL|nr:hypothetical protein [Chengkuizengella sp. 2205SS18-9]MDP5276131.1 hypothetical protein [Chengkuizengella sp. 2205SS18-9]
MKRKLLSIAFTLLIILTLVLSGCGQKPGPKQMLNTAYDKSFELESYSFDGNIDFSMNVPAEAIAAEPEMAMIAGMLQDINMNISGVYQLNPVKIEMILDLEIPGDMSFNVNLPMIIEEERTLVKVPNIPFIPLPEEVKGKFMEFNYDELSETEEEFDFEILQKQNELIKEMSRIIFNHYNEEEYFTLLEESQFPDGADVTEVVEIKITDENFEKVVLTFVDQVFPELVDLLSSPNWSEYKYMEPGEPEKLKEDMINSRSDIISFLQDENNSLRVNDFTILNGINKDNYISYQSMKLDIDAIVEGIVGNFIINLSLSTNDINQDPNFTVDVPTENIINVIEYEEIMNSTYGGFGS